MNFETWKIADLEETLRSHGVRVDLFGKRLDPEKKRAKTLVDLYESISPHSCLHSTPPLPVGRPEALL